MGKGFAAKFKNLFVNANVSVVYFRFEPAFVFVILAYSSKVLFLLNVKSFLKIFQLFEFFCELRKCKPSSSDT